ncbi:MAG: site-specific DNA-methyltransferase [Alphaproteobacteria bacterium]
MRKKQPPPPRPLAVALVPIAQLRENPRNARRHGDRQVRQLAASIRRFGFTVPVLADPAGTILAGHGRVAAARRLGMAEVPAICLEGLSEAEAMAYAIADNRIAELAEWDRDALVLELRGLVDLDFDVELTGFTTGEIDILLDGAPAPKADPADAVPEPPAVPASRVGDLWELGDHRLLCGSATDPGDYARLMDGAKAQMLFTDPPYNVPILGNVSGLGKVRHGHFIMASGEMTAGQFTAFLAAFLAETAASMQDGAIGFVCMDWRHIEALLGAARAAGMEMKQLCVWNKTNAGMGTFYRSKHELVLVLKHGVGPHINNFRLGEGGRYRTNVWDYPGVNTFRRSREDELALHPTVKPIALVADAIRDCSRRGSLVLDPFAGSGTTILAAGRTGRLARAIELDPRYVDVAIRRWEAMTGGTARHAETGLDLRALAAERSTDLAVKEVVHVG